MADLKSETIIARATPIGSGTLAMVRASGSDVFSIADHFTILHSKKKLIEADGFKVYLGKVYENLSCSKLIDEVTFLTYKAPKSFTGENSLEIICHNNIIIVDKIIELFIQNGARLAKPGEFSKRAFENGKIDLLQAEAINEIINASNLETLEAAMNQKEGSLSIFILDLQKELLNMISYLEACFEFMEEDFLDLDLESKVKNTFFNMTQKVSLLKTSVSDSKKIRSGIKIVIAGATNSGKSTLFNKLVKKDKAIVSNIHGTTRDAIESTVHKNSISWDLVDTAGLRETNDEIEQIGIKKSLEAASEADLILLVFDQTQNLSDIQKEAIENLLQKNAQKCISIINKIDLAQKIDHNLLLQKYTVNPIHISAQTEEKLKDLELMIDQKISNQVLSQASPYLLNKRHEDLLLQIDKLFKDIDLQLSQNVPYEVIVINLRICLELMSGFSGKTLQEQVLSNIFSSFCIGK